MSFEMLLVGSQIIELLGSCNLTIDEISELLDNIKISVGIAKEEIKAEKRAQLIFDKVKGHIARIREHLGFIVNNKYMTSELLTELNSIGLHVFTSDNGFRYEVGKIVPGDSKDEIYFISHEDNLWDLMFAPSDFNIYDHIQLLGEQTLSALL